MGTKVETCESRIDGEALQAALLARVGTLRGYVARRIPARLRHVVSEDDILQEVWIAAFPALPTFEPRGPQGVDRWLMAIANARVIDALRRARRQKRGGNRQLFRTGDTRLSSACGLFALLQSPGTTPSREFHRVEAGHAVLISLRRLTGAQRQALELRFIEGLSRTEIAHKMGTSEAAISGLLFRGKRELRRLLGDPAKYFSDAPSSDRGVRTGSA
jgi:RNA polymerase sigma factor (sigma-70 family)